MAEGRWGGDLHLLQYPLMLGWISGGGITGSLHCLFCVMLNCGPARVSARFLARLDATVAFVQHYRCKVSTYIATLSEKPVAWTVLAAA